MSPVHPAPGASSPDHGQHPHAGYSGSSLLLYFSMLGCPYPFFLALPIQTLPAPPFPGIIPVLSMGLHPWSMPITLGCSSRRVLGKMGRGFCWTL